MDAEQKKGREVVLVLGAGIVNCLNKQRVKRAVDYYKDACCSDAYKDAGKVSNYNNQEIPIILSGGKGGLFGRYMGKTEAEKMRGYALKLGIEERLISLEGEALDTRGNFENSKKLIERLEADRVVVVTNKAHMKRAIRYAREILKDYEIVPFSTKPKWYDTKGQFCELGCFLYEILFKA